MDRSCCEQLSPEFKGGRKPCTFIMAKVIPNTTQMGAIPRCNV